jgi:hypothetical protein
LCEAFISDIFYIDDLKVPVLILEQELFCVCVHLFSTTWNIIGEGLQPIGKYGHTQTHLQTGATGRPQCIWPDRHPISRSGGWIWVCHFKRFRFGPRRRARSLYRSVDQSSILSINNGEVTIRLDGKTDSTVESGHEFAQLVIGKEPADEIAEMSGMILTGDAAELLDVLFPAQHPQMPNEDL